MKIGEHEDRIYGAVAAMAGDPAVSDVEYVEAIRALRSYCTSSARTLLVERQPVAALIASSEPHPWPSGDGDRVEIREESD